MLYEDNISSVVLPQSKSTRLILSIFKKTFKKFNKLRLNKHTTDRIAYIIAPMKKESSGIFDKAADGLKNIWLNEPQTTKFLLTFLSLKKKNLTYNLRVE